MFFFRVLIVELGKKLFLVEKKELIGKKYQKRENLSVKKKRLLRISHLQRLLFYLYN